MNQVGCGSFLKLLKSISFALAIAMAASLAAQDQSTTKLEGTGLWFGTYFKIRFHKNFGYYGEHHYRGKNAKDNVNSFVGRPGKVYNRLGLNFYVHKNFEAVIGPTFVVHFSPDPGNEAYDSPTMEYRVWEQLLFKSAALGRIKIYHQFRFEQRWRRSALSDSPYEYTNRYRYKFFAYIPLNTNYIVEKTIFFSPSAEIFMQSGKSIVYNPFEDFRTYNGFGYVLNKNFTFFVGHMWTIGQKSTGYEYKTNHIFRFNVYIGLDVRKDEGIIPKINLGY